MPGVAPPKPSSDPAAAKLCTKKQAGHHCPARLFFPTESLKRGRLPCGE